MLVHDFQILPSQITFLTTNTCTAECGHCSVNSGKKRRGALTAADMIKTIDQTRAIAPLKLVIFAGGEPTLLGNELLNTLAYADSIGILTRMVTNAHWATSEANAVAKLIELREAGLHELNISCDDYHTPFIPTDRIRHAWQASKGLGFSAVVIASAGGADAVLTPERIKQVIGDNPSLVYEDLDGNLPAQPSPSPDGAIRLLSNANLSRLGRGVQNVPVSSLRFPKNQRDLDQPCMWIRKSPAISPENRLLSCCGMEAARKRHLDYGDLRTEDVGTIFKRAEQDIVVQMLAKVGPYRLMKLLKTLEPDVLFWDEYSGVCEVCAHIFERDSVAQLLRKHESVLHMLGSLSDEP